MNTKFTWSAHRRSCFGEEFELKRVLRVGWWIKTVINGEQPLDNFINSYWKDTRLAATWPPTLEADIVQPEATGIAAEPDYLAITQAVAASR